MSNSIYLTKKKKFRTSFFATEMGAQPEEFLRSLAVRSFLRSFPLNEVLVLELERWAFLLVTCLHNASLSRPLLKINKDYARYSSEIVLDSYNEFYNWCDFNRLDD